MRNKFKEVGEIAIADLQLDQANPRFGWLESQADCIEIMFEEYGDYITGPKIVTAETKKAMKQILTDIQDGTFAKDFLLDMSDAGRQVHFKAMRKLASEHPSEKVGEEIRKLYSWNGEDKLINN